MHKPDEEYQLMLDKLKMICKQKNITHYALAKATGMSTSSISCLMKGKTKPYIYTMLIICDALDVSIAELLENGSFGCDTEEENLIRDFRCLSQEKKRMLRVYADMLLQYNGEL